LSHAGRDSAFDIADGPAIAFPIRSVAAKANRSKPISLLASNAAHSNHPAGRGTASRDGVIGCRFEPIRFRRMALIFALGSETG